MLRIETDDGGGAVTSTFSAPAPAPLIDFFADNSTDSWKLFTLLFFGCSITKRGTAFGKPMV